MPTLYDWFRSSAERFPDLVALEVGEQRLTYAQLQQIVKAVGADGLASVAPRRVGLVARPTIATYAGYLAAQRLGAAVVPLSAGAPAAYVETLAELADLDAVIDAGPEPAPARSVAKLVLSGLTLHRSGRRQRANGSPEPDDLAYILFTSGSTGSPKGVPIRHRHLTEYIPYCVRRFDVQPGDRFAQTFELSFDPSVFAMFVAWAGGATVVVPDRDDILAPDTFVSRRAITHWFSVPSVISLAHRFGALRPVSMPGLRWSLFAGEQFTVQQAGTWAAAAPGSVIENLYGPTETSITCTGYQLPSDRDRWPRTSNHSVPIGQPHPHLEATVLGDAGPSARGELCIRGSQRFDGYLTPTENQGRFVRITPGRIERLAQAPTAQDWYRTGDLVGWENGELVHLGRLDDQLKVRGHRVEPGQIEGTLRGLTGIENAVVVESNGALHGFYTGHSRDPAALLTELRRLLPPYLVPISVRRLISFPTTANGKIDRHRLRALA
ncbi:D-alanine--poly(phosphoribitol) ligase [Kribbella albertanoniae]|uniref:D-alanine--poly(Phosphoribitol) ligase n=2 Tax=Kribbella albertanoniae TaxID=1266829 RepID=A0A4R4QIF8_9ACTN|nr:D-alanine--poly(phosphoribitol) ligase [Kribbella albertanoniae]